MLFELTLRAKSCGVLRLSHDVVESVLAKRVHEVEGTETLAGHLKCPRFPVGRKGA